MVMSIIYFNFVPDCAAWIPKQTHSHGLGSRSAAVGHWDCHRFSQSVSFGYYLIL